MAESGKIRYDILTADSYYELIKMVNEQISKGWHPLGGAFTGIQYGSLRFFQTLVKENGI